jgi:hypothetical protein
MTNGQAGERPTIPVILSVDVEPDDLMLDPGSPSAWSGFEAAYQWLSSIRAELAERTGAPVHYTWTLRLDPQVAHVYGGTTWLVDRYSRYWEAALRAGDEIGLHPHFHRWDATAGTWRIDYTDQPSIDDCVSGGLAAFAAAFGRPCRTTHIGSWINDPVLVLLDRAGVEIDLSVRPTQYLIRTFTRGGIVSGHLPSCLGAPRDPYRPSRRNFRRRDGEDRLRLTLIPQTVAPLALTASPRDFMRRVKHFAKSRGRFATPHVQVTLTEEWRHPNSFPAVLDRVLAGGRRHLAFACRSDFGRNRLASVREAIDAIAGHPGARFTFTTPHGALALM